MIRAPTVSEWRVTGDSIDVVVRATGAAQAKDLVTANEWARARVLLRVKDLVARRCVS